MPDIDVIAKALDGLRAGERANFSWRGCALSAERRGRVLLLIRALDTAPRGLQATLDTLAATGSSLQALCVKGRLLLCRPVSGTVTVTLERAMLDQLVEFPA